MLRRAMLYTGCVTALGGAAGYSFLKYEHMKNTIDENVTYNVHTNIPNREDMINKMKDNRYQLIVIGGGATGAGIALDASTRGISTCVLEGNDFSYGTSSKSTKLLHGGVRYLEDAIKTLDFTKLLLVWEALEERSNAIRACEYMCRSVPIIMPIYQAWQVPYFWVGIKTYDLLAKLVCCFETYVPTCYYLSKSNTVQNYPLLNSESLKGSLVYYDGQHNDSRMNLNLLFTSALDKYVEGHQAAHVANYCKVIGFIKDDKNDQILGVKVHDRIADAEFDVFGKVIVNCAGPFCDEVRRVADADCQTYISPSAAAGSHIVLPHRYTSTNYGLIIPETTDKRVLFLLPWENSTIVGTTDERSLLTDAPKPQQKEIDFIVQEICKYVNVDQLQLREDIKSEWCGLRPLVSRESKMKEGSSTLLTGSTSKISRSHEIILDPNGLVSLMGGKWTTYRRMAQDTVDEVLRVYKDKLSCKISCRTKNLKLIGSFDEKNEYKAEDVRAGTGRLPSEIIKKFKKVKYESAEHLVRNYGFTSLKVLQIGDEMDLNTRMHEDYPFLKSEVVYAVRHEMARRVSDVIGRRVRIAFLDIEAAKEVVPTVVDLMAKELNWTAKDIEDAKSEANTYLNTLCSC